MRKYQEKCINFVNTQPKNRFVMGNYIRFDWAIKRLLRDKANFVVLEGFLTTLLGEPIHISRLLESEGNQEREDAKFNRVDILAENDKGELFLIEVQNNDEYAYFQRMLFGTSKLVTEYIKRGNDYDQVKKVYSVNVVYFPLGGHGQDVVYRGKTEFHGIKTGELLELTSYQQKKFNAGTVSQLEVEYYLLKVNNFNSVAKTPLEEWIQYLKTGDIPENATAPGLAQARERLQLDRMSPGERRAYERHIDDLVSLRDTIVNTREESLFNGLEKGRAEGLAIGIKEGEKKSQLDIARQMKSDGLPVEFITKYTGLSDKEIADL